MSFTFGMLSDAINESEINLYPFDGERPIYLIGTGSGNATAEGTGSAFFGREVTGSGNAIVSGTASAYINTFIRVQVMHTDRTLYIPEDIREVWVSYDEDRTVEIPTEYREIDVPAEVSYYS